MLQGRLVIAALAVAAALAGPASAQPSSTLADYVLFAETQIKTKGLTVPCGDIGVNRAGGILRAPQELTVAGACASDVGRLTPLANCSTLYANFTYNAPPGAVVWTPPILADLAAECAFPDPFPTCDLLAPITVDAGTTLSLAPGVYGNLTVKGGIDPITFLPTPGILQLQGGTYRFCNVKVTRYSEVRALAPVTVNVFGVLKTVYNNYLGPDTGSKASDFVVNVNGPKAHYSRYSQVVARLCAPRAKCRLTAGGDHAGWVWCDNVRTEDINFTCASPGGAFVD
jgi:hypothetical protein